MSVVDGPSLRDSIFESLDNADNGGYREEMKADAGVIALDLMLCDATVESAYALDEIDFVGVREIVKEWQAQRGDAQR